MFQVNFANLLNVGHDIVFDAGAGPKTYTIKALTKGGEARFARWLEKRVRDDAARALLEMPPEQAEQYAAGSRRDIAAGLYGWGSPACVIALNTREGQDYAIMLSLTDSYPELDEETISRMIEQHRRTILDMLAAKVEEGDPKVIRALTDMMGALMLGNTTGETSSSSQTRHTAGNRGKSKRRRKRR